MCNPSLIYLMVIFFYVIAAIVWGSIGLFTKKRKLFLKGMLIAFVIVIPSNFLYLIGSFTSFAGEKLHLAEEKEFHLWISPEKIEYKDPDELPAEKGEIIRNIGLIIWNVSFLGACFWYPFKMEKIKIIPNKPE